MANPYRNLPFAFENDGPMADIGEFTRRVEPPLSDTPNMSGTQRVQPYRQGIYMRGPLDIFAGTQIKARAPEPNHFLGYLTHGQPSPMMVGTFNPADPNVPGASTAFVDGHRLVAEENLISSNNIIATRAKNSDPYFAQAFLEPLTIRNIAERKGISRPQYAHKVRADVTSNPVESRSKRTTEIDDKYDYFQLFVEGRTSAPLDEAAGMFYPLSQLTPYNLLRPFVDDDGNRYTIEATRNLRLWMQMTATTPTDRTGNSTTVLAYANSPTTQEFNLPPAFKRYKSVTFADIANQEARVTNTDGLFCFTSLANEGTPTATSDEPFSISLWANLTDAATTNYLFAKRGVSSPWYEYYANVTSAGVVNFFMADTDAGATDYLQTYTANIGPSGTGQIQSGTWVHLVFTYDGSASASGMNIYVDGELQSATKTYSGTYVGMEPNYALSLYVGAWYAGNDEMDGQMSEFAAWGKELTATEIKAIYNLTAKSVGLKSFVSVDQDFVPRTFLGAFDDSKTLQAPTTVSGSSGTYIELGNSTLGVQITGDDTRNALLAMHPQAGAELLGSYKKSATTGFVFDSRYGTDSIAFGGLKK